jgi:molybdenum cofactor cytidylyltransferase
MSVREVAAIPSVVEVTHKRLPFDDIARVLDAHDQCLLVGMVERAAKTDESLLQKQLGLTLQQVDDLLRHAGELGLSALLVEADGSRMLPVKAPGRHEPVLPTATTVLIPVGGMDAIGQVIHEQIVHRPQQLLHLLGISPKSQPIRLSPGMLAKILTHQQGGAKNLPPGARLLPLFNKAEKVTRYVFARLACQQLVLMGKASLVGAVGTENAPAVRERWAPLTAVVLAAGESRRMGRPKQLISVDGEPMVLRAVRIALESGASRVCVVTGAYAGEVTAILGTLPGSTNGMLEIVHNPQWQSGQASSIRTGVRSASVSTGAMLFLPGDQPFLKPVYLRRMLTKWRQGTQIVASEVEGATRGAPALFDRQFLSELSSIDGDGGGRILLERHRDVVEAVPMPEAILRDIDTPSDLNF